MSGLGETDLLDRCLTGLMHQNAQLWSNPFIYKQLGASFLFDRCLTDIRYLMRSSVIRKIRIAASDGENYLNKDEISSSIWIVEWIETSQRKGGEV